MSAPVPLHPSAFPGSGAAPARAADPAADPAAWRVAVAGTGPMTLLVADALLNQPYLPVRVTVLDPELPALHRIGDREPSTPTPQALLLRRVLRDPRVDLSFGAGHLDADAVLHAATARTGTVPHGVATARQVRRQASDPGPATVRGTGSGRRRARLARELASAESVVVAGSTRAAVTLVRAAGTAAAPDLRDIHLVLIEAALHGRAAAAAFEELLELDVNVVADPGAVATGHPGAGCPRCCLPRSLAALTALAERFDPAAGGWLHVTTGAEPVQLIGRERVEAVVLAKTPPGATEPELSTVTADLFTHDGTVALVPEGTGVRLIPAAAAGRPPAAALPGRYLAVGTGRAGEDAARAQRAVDAFVSDALRQRLVRRARPRVVPAGTEGGKVIPLPTRRPARQAAAGSS